MKLIGDLKKQVDNAKDISEKRSIIEKAGMKLSDDELDMVAGGQYIDGWQYWRSGNPWGYSSPFNYYTGEGYYHDHCANCVGIAIESGDYEKAKSEFANYSSRYSGPEFDCVRRMLNQESIDAGLGPLM